MPAPTYTQDDSNAIFRQHTRLGYSEEEATFEAERETGISPQVGAEATAAVPPSPGLGNEDDKHQALSSIEDQMAAERMEPLAQVEKSVWNEIRDVGGDVIDSGRKAADRVKQWAKDSGAAVKGGAWEKATKPLGDAARWYQSLPDETGYELAVRWHRLNNFVELVGGSALQGLETVHQTYLAALMWPTDAMDWEGVKKRGMPLLRWPTEGLPFEQPGTGELPIRDSIHRRVAEEAALRQSVDLRAQSDQVFEDINQLRQLAENDGVVLSEAVLNANWLDFEPWIMEEAGANRLVGADVVDAWLGGRLGEALTNDPYVAWPTFGVISTAIDFFDPLLLAEIAPSAFRAAGRGWGALTGGKPVWQAVAGPLADTMALRTRAVRELNKAMSDAAKDPDNAKRAAKVLQKEKEYLNIEASIRTVLPESKDVKALEKGVDFEDIAKRYVERVDAQGPAVQKGPQRRAHTTVLNMADDGPTPSEWLQTQGVKRKVSDKLRKKRQLAMARNEASDGWVDVKLSEAGWADREAFEAEMRLANQVVKSGGDENAFNVAVGKWNQLPKEVRNHLDIMGWSPDRIMRQNALRQQQLVPDGDLTIANLAEYRAFMGADDGETLGDAVRRVMLGARGDDVTIHGAIVPEYSVLQQGRYAEWGDGLWLRDLPVPNRVDTESGLRVMPDKLPIRLGRAIGGMTPGSLHLRLPRIVFGGARWADNALNNVPSAAAGKAEEWGRVATDFIGGLRQPQNALAHTGAYDVYRAGHGNYISRVIAQENWFEGVMKAGKMGKRNKNGRFQYTGNGAERARAVFRALDNPDAVDAAATVAKMDPDTQKVYFSMRSWFDNAARELQLEEGQRVSQYAPHVFPTEELSRGMRPLEFVGLPLKGDVAFNHLLPRTGASGYSEDLMAVWQLYNRGMRRKLDMEPTYNRMLAMADDLIEQGDTATAQYLQELTHTAKGYPQSLDSWIQRTWKQAHPDLADFNKMDPATQAAMRTSSLFYTGLLAGNMNYFMQNLSTAVASTTGRHGGLHTARGLLKMMAPGPVGKAARKLAKESGVTAEMRHTMTLLNDTKMGRYVEWVGRNMGIEQSEFVNRGLSMHASLSEQLKRAGMTADKAIEAGAFNGLLAQAVRDAEQVQHVYGRMGRSPYMEKVLGRGGVQTALQFLSFPFKHGEMLMSMGKENPGYVLRYMAYSGYLARLAADAGVDVSTSLGGAGLNPLDISEDKPGRGPTSMLTAPPVDALGAAAKFLLALESGDPNRVKEEGKQIVKTVTSLAPMVNQSFKYSKNIHDFAQGFREGRTPEEMEETLGAGFTVDGQLNPDLVPTLLNLRKFEGERRKRIFAEAQENENANLFRMQRGTKDFIAAYRRGDQETMNKVVSDLLAQGIILNDAVLERHEMAAKYERLVRDLMADPTKFPMELMEMLNTPPRGGQQ